MKMDDQFSRKRRFHGVETLSEDSSDDETDFVEPPPTKKPYENYISNSMGMMQQMNYIPSEESSDDETDFVESPSAKQPYENYSTTSLRMMQKMGYQPGETGLGKEGQGRLEPIEASTQKGRRGFGLKLEGLDVAAAKWTEDMEIIQLRETANFISDYSEDLETKSYDELRAWMVEGPKKISMEDETQFCDPDVLRNVLAQKTVFDNLGADDMRNARTRSNPFETIGSATFLNRAAVKMANIDALFDFMFTNPVDEDGRPLVKEYELLYFADVCAGPGGFSEYGKYY